MILPVLLAMAIGAGGPAADDDDDDAGHMPEPLLVESTTDVDGAQPGEFELDVDLFASPSVANSIAGTRIEAEWRATRRLGMAIELSFAREAKVIDNYAFGARFAASYVLIHDFIHDFHVQAVGSFHVPLESDEDIAHDAAETALPFGAGLHAAWLIDPIELRFEVLGEAGEIQKSAHAPIHAGLVGLLLIDGLGYGGLEFIQDWALEQPFTVAPEIVFDGEKRHLPFRLGVTFPIHLGVSADRAYNVITRLVLELD